MSVRLGLLVLSVVLSSCVHITVDGTPEPPAEAPVSTAGRPLGAFPEAASPSRAVRSVGAAPALDMLDRFLVDAADVDGEASRVVLAAGRLYTVTVAGTYSVWGAQFWGATCTGQVEPAPMFGSRRRSGPVGMDPSFRFAVPRHARALCDLPDVSPRPGWSYRWADSDLWVAVPASPAYRADHTYTYQIRGAGRPIHVRAFEQAEFRDNYGQLEVTIFAPAN